MALFSEMMDEMSEKDRELAEWKQAAGVEAGLRREFLARAEKAEAELRATLKAVLHHFGPEGASKVITSALAALASDPGGVK